MSASWINKLNESDSRLHKEDVVKQALEAAILGSINSQAFLGLAKACYNPYVTFGVKQIPDTVGIIDAENPWDDFNELLVQLSQRKLTGHAARDAIADMSVRFDSNEWNTFCAAVVRRDLRAGISSTTINKICKTIMCTNNFTICCPIPNSYESTASIRRTTFFSNKGL